MIDVLRSNRKLTAILGTVFLLLIVLTVVNRDEAYPQDDLHPENPDPNGARAVAQVLEDQGVTVQVAHNQDELRSFKIGAGTTLMVSSTLNLGESTSRFLAQQAGAATTVVVAAPPPPVVDQLAPGLQIGGVFGGKHEAECGDPLLSGLRIDVRRSPGYSLDGATECFTDGADALVIRVDPLREGLPMTYVVGGADLFSNHSVLDADNAAVALRLLGGNDRLVWYVPDPADLSASEGARISDLLPHWLVPSLILVGAALVGLVLWRGRRLGPVVVEPLPVVVRNREAVEARGRLYRRTGDRDHAARALRTGAVERLVDHVALPPETGLDLLVSEVSRVTGRPAADVAGLLKHSPVDDDASLVALAGALALLESEVGDA